MFKGVLCIYLYLAFLKMRSSNYYNIGHNEGAKKEKNEKSHFFHRLQKKTTKNIYKMYMLSLSWRKEKIHTHGAQLKFAF